MASREKAAALLALRNIDAKIEEVVKASGLEVFDLLNEHLRDREPFLKRRRVPEETANDRKSNLLVKWM